MERYREQLLTGGRLTTGVVRIGNTVRRPVSQASPFVAELLTHLAAKGFAGCPRHLGWDSHERDILSYIPGEVPARWQRFDDRQIMLVVLMLRHMHEVTRDFAFLNGLGEVVCHNDPGPK